MANPRLFGLALLGLIWLGLVEPASSSFIYSYEGNLFTVNDDEDPPAGSYDLSKDRVTGFFTLDSRLPANQPLTPIIGLDGFAFWFSEGRNTIDDPSDLDTFRVEVATANGEISAWNIFLFEPRRMSIGEQRVFIESTSGTDFVTEDRGLINEVISLEDPPGPPTQINGVDRETEACRAPGHSYPSPLPPAY